MTRQDALDKIKKLLALADPARNPSPEEADTARRMASKLIETHGITDDELTDAVARDAQAEFEEASKEWAREWVNTARGGTQSRQTARLVWSGREFTAWEHASNNLAFEFSGGRKVIVCLDSAEEMAKVVLLWAQEHQRLLRNAGRLMLDDGKILTDGRE